MRNREFVSVIVPTYNRSNYIVEAISSAIRQTFKYLEIIVIDDGSSDNTVEILEPYMRNIQYIYQPNQGVSSARNKGIRASKGELIAFLDADDVWFSQKLERQIECLEKNPQVGLIHSDALYLNEETDLRSQRNVPAGLYEGNCYVQLFLGNRIAMSSVVLRRECLEKVGVFDETIRKSPAEDYDLWLRIARYFEFAYINEPLVLYRMHATNAIKDTRTLRRSELYVLEKNLKMDPALVDRVGRQVVRRRFFSIWHEMAYESFNLGDFREANRSFSRALQFRLSLYTFMLWLATLLPSNVVKNMRRFKQYVGSRL